MKRFTTALKTTTMAIAVAGLMASSAAYATDGMHGHGNGARQKALAGAGVADSTDATAASLNPAGLVHVEDQLNVSLSLFSPHREVNRFGDDWQTSDGSTFVIPNIAYSHRLNSTTVLGLSAYANGGMNTDFKSGSNFADIGFGGGLKANSLSANIEQLLVSAAIAKQFGSFSIGIAPIFAVQSINVKGLQGYDNALWTSDIGNVTNRGIDWSYGGGIRAGVEWEAMPGLRLGAAGNSRIYMSKFSKYSGMLAEQGDMDMPATIQVGLAADVQPNLTVMFDYKRIFYGSIDALANSGPIESDADDGFPAVNRQMGTDNGIGFGWQDLNIFKVGVEWDVDPSITLRAGYSYNDNPLDSDDLVFNIIAPATVQHHITGGMKIAATDTLDIEFAGAYMPNKTISGADHGPGGDANDCQLIGGAAACGNFGDDVVGLKMSQWELTMGINWKLGSPEAPLK